MLAYLRLFRLPNVFTAMADILMGFSFAWPAWEAAIALPALLLASACLYTAGMVWNDVFDIEVDRVERPRRPLPSGQISLSTARRLGTGLLVAGWAFSLLAAMLAPQPYSRWLAPSVASLLIVLILAYNSGAKFTLAGPWVMGACRVANVLLGMSLLPASATAAAAGAGSGLIWPPPAWCAALGIGAYISGVTWFARQEASEVRLGPLMWGVLWIIVGLSLLAAIPWAVQEGHGQPFRVPRDWWALFVLVLGLTILRRCLAAIAKPSPKTVQQAVKFAILSLIMLDAAVTLLVAQEPWMAAVVALLILPAWALGSWIYST